MQNTSDGAADRLLELQATGFRIYDYFNPPVTIAIW